MKIKAFCFQHDTWIIALITFFASVWSGVYFYSSNSLLLYGDAESHLNIAKRVIDSLTPGFAQLGGIWLPLPHILLLPFVAITPFWHSGIAGSIVGGLSFIVATVYLYKIGSLLLQKKIPALIACIVFICNPNILYMQSTALGELPLIAFFLMSVYYFLKYIKHPESLPSLIFSALFALCASLCRYDGWFLVIFEIIGLSIFFIFYKRKWSEGEGMIVVFSTLAFFGIFLWFLWDGVILHDPLYFTNSPFSAKSQQEGWLARGELITYKNIWLSVVYYADTIARNTGIFLTACMLVGLVLFLFDRKQPLRLFTILLLGFPFVFYVSTLYLGQSIILLPDLTPTTFMWHLFNVRYGVIMLPFVAILIGFLLSKSNKFLRILLIAIIVIQTISFATGTEPTITLEDGRSGLSAMKQPDAQQWMARHYDKGTVLLDDFARTISIIKSNIPIQNVIYVGNHPYWENALKKPQNYVTWVVVQKDDAVWKEIYAQPSKRDNLYKYYQKVYTSPDILIFKRNTLPS